MAAKNSIISVDTHVHMIEIKRYPYKWPRPIDEAPIYRDFLPQDYQAERSQTDIRYAVLVEVFESAEETEWFLKMERDNEFIKGVVGWANMNNPKKLEEEICRLKKLGQLVGLRQILDFAEDGWLQRDDVIRSMNILANHNLTFDLLIKSRPQYESAKQFLKLIPSHLKVVIDHLGKPDAKNGASDQWYKDVEEFASYQNTYCKLSGMVTEADWENWKTEDFKAHVGHVIKCFGINRVMFGSDWPVCKLAHANLPDVHGLLDQLLQHLSQANRDKIFFSNAVQFYGLDL